jgi:hypothetical protein
METLELILPARAAKHHGGDPEKSPRLRVLLDILSDGQWHSSLYLENALRLRGEKTVAIGSCVADLRKSGKRICCRYSCTTESGNRIYMYRLII